MGLIAFGFLVLFAIGEIKKRGRVSVQHEGMCAYQNDKSQKVDTSFIIDLIFIVIKRT